MKEVQVAALLNALFCPNNNLKPNIIKFTMIYKSEKELEQENVEHFCLIIDLKRLTELDFLSIVFCFVF